MKIKLNEINKEFKNEKVLNNISYTFEKGKTYGIVGRNGSGKSVLLKILAGFYVPTSGEITIDNKKYVNYNEPPYDMGIVIGKPMFIEDITGKENLVLLSKIKNIINEEEIDKFMKVVGLDLEKDKKYSKY